MIPGMAGKVSQEQVWTIEKKLKVAQSIIEQMTPEERTDPDILISGDDAKMYVRCRRRVPSKCDCVLQTRS
jgi:signal recognition particle GTPase